MACHTKSHNPFRHFRYLGGFIVWNIDNFFCSSLRGLRESNMPSGLKPLTQLHGWWHVLAGYATYMHILHCIFYRLVNENVGWGLPEKGSRFLSDLKYCKIFHSFPTYCKFLRFQTTILEGALRLQNRRDGTSIGETEAAKEVNLIIDERVMTLIWTLNIKCVSTFLPARKHCLNEI